MHRINSGDVVFVELPSVDDPVTKDEPFTVVESVKAASDVYSPVTGVITAVNEDLEDSPELINESPYDEGWIIEVELDDTEGRRFNDSGRIRRLYKGRYKNGFCAEYKS